MYYSAFVVVEEGEVVGLGLVEIGYGGAYGRLLRGVAGQCDAVG